MTNKTVIFRKSFDDNDFLPVCELANKFWELAGSIIYTTDLEIIHDMGYNIVIEEFIPGMPINEKVEKLYTEIYSDDIWVADECVFVKQRRKWIKELIHDNLLLKMLKS